MFWRLLVKIGMSLLESLIVEFVLFVVRAFFVNYCKPQSVSVA